MKLITIDDEGYWGRRRLRSGDRRVVVGPDGAVTYDLMAGHGARALTFPSPDGDVTMEFHDSDFMKRLDAANPM